VDCHQEGVLVCQGEFQEALVAGVGSSEGGTEGRIATSLRALFACMRPNPVPKSKPVSNPAVSMSIAVRFMAW
jgi:hypothetical protein